MTRNLPSFIGNVFLVASALGFALITTPALAKDTGAYVGGSVGITSIDVCDDLNALGFTSCDDTDTGFKIYGGYKFNRNFAVEGGLVDFGELTASTPSATATVESDALFAAAVGILPLTGQFSLFAKAGLFFWDVNATGTAGSVSDDGTDLLFGLGLYFDITRYLGVRAEWESYDAGGDDVTLLSAGIQYNF